MSVDWNAVSQTISAEWDETVLPALSAYIEVPNQSPHFDAEWATNGLMGKAMDVIVEWVKNQPIKGLKYEVLEEKGRTPFLIVEVDGTEPTANTLLLYGHMDKQPPLPPWDEGLHPQKAVYRDGKLYGRGAADDGYAIFSTLTALAAVQKHGLPHGHVVVIIEAGEESGSEDLPYYIDRLSDRIGNVDLLICLDSGAMTYDKLWLTTALRGVACGILTVETMSESMHSGISGGVVPDPFRIARILLNRVEDQTTGEVKVPEAHCAIPEAVVKNMEIMNEVNFMEHFALLPGVSPASDDNVELALRNSWKPALTVTGADLPDPATAGNVIRAKSTLRISLRLPPSANADDAANSLKKMLEADPPYGAKVHFEPDSVGYGFSTPELEPWLAKALNEGSMTVFGKPFASQGLGGSIPFIAMLLKRFPKAQFVVTGTLGPKSNAHGPNEFLHVPFTKGLTTCVARVMADHFHATPKLKTEKIR
ncbi:putative peptidase M20/M25/M40 [Trypanosoma cruzi]|uniref:Peptidase M20/M25/M40 n=2 Tax=Trypanosoma cruzi TaxID=5693 RepID=V5BHA2_TRYCR|nr:peptidase M20/M25/M40 [Trypanosoma cruzi Dm28c]PBJ71861.1 peptidase M20/M25/M40 [Trypanosoma cruzi cruzi]PWU97994.1 putative cytosolic nonspecific dipeptidase [Trypanosoma cruzi]RNF23831.1 putative peptidase M20/M25/M40 [Trypanosoma cruzi]